MNPLRRRWLLFTLFFVSGFSSLVYQIVWTRLAFASFGIITPVLSVVLSVFMLGLSLGSWISGRSVSTLERRTGVSAIVLYAGTELLIGLGAFAVPKLFSLGARILLAAGQSNSIYYLSSSALVLAISILPWCILMGATFPFMMAHIRERETESEESFSYLYLANVLGAMLGALLSALVLVELLGFHGTLLVAALGNCSIAAVSLSLGLKQRAAQPAVSPGKIADKAARPKAAAGPGGGFSLWILFLTGFSSMAMEVVWTRAFIPVLQTQVYSFASIVFTYLLATGAGSFSYRWGIRRGRVFSIAGLIASLAIAGFVPVVLNDPRWLIRSYSVSGHVRNFHGVFLVLFSIIPLCAVLGYLTPSLIDGFARGRPAEAGKAYAVNVLGCILGPLIASYVLLPYIGERWCMIILGLPLLGLYLITAKRLALVIRTGTAVAMGAVLVWSVWFSGDFVTAIRQVVGPNLQVRRDYAASVLSFGRGMEKQLLVNGIGMTTLTPITKFMVHLTAAFHQERPESALVICFGMGTTYRSALSWNLETTAVELVPGVAKAFGYYHADAASVLQNPRGRIVIDDGRRYLARTREKFDLIIIDPPPPIGAAGSSLLYTREFYDLAKQHLKPDGILQAWFPGGDTESGQAIFRSCQESFPYVRGFYSITGMGIHLFCSMRPIPAPKPAEIAARMPESAKKDLMEWAPSGVRIDDYIQIVLSREVNFTEALNPNLRVQITDDCPFNEYYLLRHAGISWR